MDNRTEETYEKAKSYWKKIEPTNTGMLGNIPFIHYEDIKGSTLFLRQVLKSQRPGVGNSRCLDCGSGIGRISKDLLCKEFVTVDILEQEEKFCEMAKKNLQNCGNLGNVYNLGLQEFVNGTELYNIIWCQWFLGHLLEKDLIESMKSLSKMLTTNGMIIIKENFTHSSEIILDDCDSSVTRPLKLFKQILKKANLRVVKETRQLNFPKDIFPVYMLAVKPIK